MPMQGKIPVLTAMPTIPVRLNRTLVLRQQCQAKRGDAHQSFNPQKSEMGPYVSGINKAAKQNCVKQLNTWYREQTFFLEKMNRYQTHTYDKLGRLEKEKKQLVSYIDQLGVSESEFAEDVVVSQPEPSQSLVKSVGFKETVKEMGEPTKAYHLPPLQETSEENETKEKIKEEPPPRAPSGLMVSLSLPAFDKTSSEPLSPILKDTNLISRSTEDFSAITLPDSKKCEKDTVFHLTESPVPGAQRAPIPVPDSAGSNMEPKDLYQKLKRQRPSTDNTKQTSVSFMKISRSKSLMTDRFSKSLDNKKWTMYRKEPTGEIKPVDYPYKRKEFEKPREKDYGMYRQLLKAEEKCRKKATKKFAQLSDDIDALESWNPLDEIRYKYHERPVDPLLASDKKAPGMTGSFGAMIAAFVGKEEWLLKQLDPNSPEALKLCRYLRLKENGQQEGLEDVEERLLRRDSWQAQIPDVAEHE